VKVTSRVPPPPPWQKFQIIVDCLSPIDFGYVSNQSRGHWLLNDVLHSIISMSLKLKKENKIIPSFDIPMEDDSIIFD
jgi:hypothetical protein